eukprot:gene1032-4111_t
MPPTLLALPDCDDVRTEVVPFVELLELGSLRLTCRSWDNTIKMFMIRNREQLDERANRLVAVAAGGYDTLLVYKETPARIVGSNACDLPKPPKGSRVV